MNIKEIIINKLKNNKEFAQNFIWRTIQTLGKQGTSFAIFLVATIFLAKEEMGVYNYIFSALYVLTIFSDFGISTATSKYAAEYNVVNKEKLQKILSNTLIMITTFSVLVIIISLIFGQTFFGQYYSNIFLVLPIVFFSPLTSLYDGIYRGLKRFKELAIISLITGVISILISCFLSYRLGLLGALISQNILYIVYAIVLAVRYTDWKLSFDKGIIKEIGKYSLIFGIATLGYYMFSRINILILGRYNFLEEIASYELLNKFFTIFILPFTILGQVLAPYITENFAKKKFKYIENFYYKFLKIFALVALAFIPITYFATKIVVSLFFKQYDNDMLYMLLIPVIIVSAKNVLSAPLNAGMMVATGDAGLMTYQNLIAGAINIVVSFWAIEKFGYMGVIWSTVFIQLIFFVILNIFYITRLKKHVKST